MFQSLHFQQLSMIYAQAKYGRQCLIDVHTLKFTFHDKYMYTDNQESGVIRGKAIRLTSGPCDNT